MSIELVDPTVIERIRFEKVGADRSAYTTKFSLRYSKDKGMPSKPYMTQDNHVSLAAGLGFMVEVLLIIADFIL